jgi:N-acyl-D-amino-acid deacylase
MIQLSIFELRFGITRTVMKCGAIRNGAAVVALFSLAALTAISAGSAQEYDLLIRGGRIVDGTGNPAFHADLALTNGRIAAIGRNLAGSAREVIDASGAVVAPGFIDVHTHAENIDDLPRAENFLRMGVTTLVLGNCGTSAVNMGDFFRRLEATNISANVATLIGHGSVRNRVMRGSFMRPPTEEELDEMKGLVDRAMQDGAVGMSTGLIYLPGTFAKTEELIALARVAAKYDGIYVSHMRDEGRQIFEALNELFRIAREAGCRAEVSHIKLSGPVSWGKTAEVLAAIDRARQEGLDITQDQYVYTASSTGISQLVPEEWREGGKFLDNLSNAVTRAKMVEQMQNNLTRNGRTNYAYAVIASYSHDPSLNGLNIVEAAKKKRGGDSVDDQIQVILEIQANGGASGVFHGINESDLQMFLQQPNTMVGSDSGVRRFKQGVPHPRGYGNAARVLARYVREQHLLRLEDAVRKMTSLPAATFRLKDRGQLREGAWGDITVFDPATVQDHASFNEPHQYATGFKYVMVNGRIVVRDDVHIGVFSGKTLKRGVGE